MSSDASYKESMGSYLASVKGKRAKRRTRITRVAIHLFLVLRSTCKTFCVVKLCVYLIEPLKTGVKALRPKPDTCRFLRYCLEIMAEAAADVVVNLLSLL